jgi:uncharacterized protein
LIAVRTILATLGIVAVAATVSLTTPAYTQSAETLAAADRLMAAQDINKMMNDMATNVADRLPGATDAQKQAFIAEMTAPEFLSRFRDETRKAMAKSFSAEELNALADFYSKPIAKAAMAKMGPYTADMMAFVQREIPSMVQRIQQTK